MFTLNLYKPLSPCLDCTSGLHCQIRSPCGTTVYVARGTCMLQRDSMKLKPETANSRVSQGHFTILFTHTHTHKTQQWKYSKYGQTSLTSLIQ